MENKVNAVIDAATLTKVEAALASINTELPFLVELTTDQSKRLIKMEDGRVEFVRKALALADVDSRIKPQFLSLEDAEKDIAVCESLDKIIVKTKKTLKLLEDTRTVAGSEALAAALEIYNTTKRGTAKGAEGMKSAYDELSPFFEKQGNSNPKNTDNTK